VIALTIALVFVAWLLSTKVLRRAVPSESAAAMLAAGASMAVFVLAGAF
jgi:hypothetical protein